MRGGWREWADLVWVLRRTATGGWLCGTVGGGTAVGGGRRVRWEMLLEALLEPLQPRRGCRCRRCRTSATSRRARRWGGR